MLNYLGKNTDFSIDADIVEIYANYSQIVPAHSHRDLGAPAVTWRGRTLHPCCPPSTPAPTPYAAGAAQHHPAAPPATTRRPTS